MANPRPRPRAADGIAKVPLISSDGPPAAC